MKYVKKQTVLTSVIFFLSTVLLLNLCIATAFAETEDKDTVKIVGTQKITSTLLAGDRKISVSGRISFYLTATEKEFEEGILNISGFNVVYFNVPQADITGIKPKGKATGVLGFAVDAKKGQQLNYDAKNMALRGMIQGTVDFQQLAELSEKTYEKGSDDIMIPGLDANLEVAMQFKEPIVPEKAAYDIVNVKGIAKTDMYIYESDTRKIKDFSIYTEDLELVADYSFYYWIEVAKNLVIQPVRVATRRFSFPYIYLVNLSGDGLAFGMPGARTEWKKADITFTVRDFKTINMYTDEYLVLSAGEEDTLCTKVVDDDAIEIFFVDSFSPADRWGGGATFYGGLSHSFIITSDGNADGGIDFTHLAHELGHVLTLKHPGQGFPTDAYPYRYDASSGTLMCPSGYLNDNPQINSEENETYADNPLLTFSLKGVSAGPDCTDSADCGPCP